MAQQKKITPVRKPGGEPKTAKSLGDCPPARQLKTGENSATLRDLLKAAEAADEGRGTDLTTMTHEERMRALFG